MKKKIYILIVVVLTIASLAACSPAATDDAVSPPAVSDDAVSPPAVSDDAVSPPAVSDNAVSPPAVSDDAVSPPAVSDDAVSPPAPSESTAGSNHSAYGAVGSFSNAQPTLDQMLTYAIQDEYLARSEYEYIIDELGAANPFVNIIKAEEKHIALLIPLLEKYEYAIPEDTSKEHLIVPDSITQALETGVQAEIDNIAMYESFLTRDLPDDVRDVFISLRDASENHLAAFQRKLSR